MPKIKLTKGELKKQRDALAQYERYLPTLQLKKKQLQMEILHEQAHLEEKINLEANKRKTVGIWLGLVSEAEGKIKHWLKPKNILTATKNIAGVDLPIFERVDFEVLEYDLFLSPLWFDAGLEALRNLVSIREEINVIKRGIALLKLELLTTTQRVNLFEKVKIPEAQEAIRKIKIYIGDQLSNAVCRSKIAKNKIEEAVLV